MKVSSSFLFLRFSGTPKEVPSGHLSSVVFDDFCSSSLGGQFLLLVTPPSLADIGNAFLLLNIAVMMMVTASAAAT